MLGIKEIAQAEATGSLRDLESRYAATSARHLLAAYAINQKYKQLGAVMSPLGLPIDDDLNARMDVITKANQQGGYQAQFRGGVVKINDSANIPVLDTTNKVKVWFVGLECQVRQESEDEVFGTIGVIRPSTKLSRGVDFPPGTDYLKMGKDGTRTVQLQMLLYDDVPADLVLTINLIEHDSGDIEEYKRRIAAALSTAAQAGLGSVGVPAEATAASQGFIGAVTWGLVNVVSGWLGADDDAYNPNGFRISGKDVLIHIGIENGSIKGVASPFQDRTMERPDTPGVVLHYNIDPVVVSGTDQGGDLGVYTFYFKVETYVGTIDFGPP
jgi:hypothetical protein